jgi:hypothetical protein
MRLNLLTAPLAILFLFVLAPRAPAQCGPAYIQELRPPDPQNQRQLGRNVSLSGDVIAAGSGLIDYEVGGPGTGFRGAVYVWRRSGGSFALEQKIPGPAHPQAQFGEAVAVDGDALVASQHANSYPAESARVFRRIGGVWTEEAFLMPSDPLFTNGIQIRAVGIQGDWVAVGHRTALANPLPAPYTGAVYLYRRTAGAWSQHAKLVPADAQNGDLTGWSLDLRGDVLAFSSRCSPLLSSPAPGRVHVYGLHGGSPLLEATLTASTPGQGRNFGYAVSTDGARLAISDPDDREVPGNIGAVYVFRRVGTAWVEEQVIRPFLPAGGAAFGREVTIDGDNLYAGAHAAWPSQIHHFKRVGGVWVEMGNSAVTNPSPWGVLALDAQGGELAAGVPTVYNESGGVYTFDGNASGQVCTYCTSKVNSLGCAPAMDYIGAPSATNAGPFVVRGTNVRNNKTGLLFYGVSGQASGAFQGGTLCIKSVIRRAPGVSSAGTPAPANDCSGIYQIDMNAFAAGLVGGNPLPGLSVVGTIVHCQWWGRDPGFAPPNNTTLTNALKYTVGS